MTKLISSSNSVLQLTFSCLFFLKCIWSKILDAFMFSWLCIRSDSPGKCRGGFPSLLESESHFILKSRCTLAPLPPPPRREVVGANVWQLLSLRSSPTSDSSSIQELVWPPHWLPLQIPTFGYHRCWTCCVHNAAFGRGAVQPHSPPFASNITPPCGNYFFAMLWSNQSLSML